MRRLGNYLVGTVILVLGISMILSTPTEAQPIMHPVLMGPIQPFQIPPDAILAVEPNLPATGTRKLLDAIREVETGGEPNKGRDAVGDDGDSLGPYQIGRLYWEDAVEYNPQLDDHYTYEDVTSWVYAEQVMFAYWGRYGSEDTDFEELARLHNGGPKGPERDSTLDYWKRVKTVLDNE